MAQMNKKPSVMEGMRTLGSFEWVGPVFQDKSGIVDDVLAINADVSDCAWS